MGLNELTGVTGSMIKLALDAASLRHLVIASNIANANTPGYVPVRVEFEEHLAAAARNRTYGAYGAGLGRSVAPAVVPDLQQGFDPLQARVQLDVEAAQLAQNTLQYQALLRGFRGRLEMLQMAIGEGRG
jgi:flagellar basal-body rod protein FlgB